MNNKRSFWHIHEERIFSHVDPSNATAISTFWIKVNLGAKLLSDVAGVVIIFFDNPLDFHAKVY